MNFTFVFLKLSKHLNCQYQASLDIDSERFTMALTDIYNITNIHQHACIWASDNS